MNIILGHLCPILCVTSMLSNVLSCAQRTLFAAEYHCCSVSNLFVSPSKALGNSSSNRVYAGLYSAVLVMTQ